MQNKKSDAFLLKSSLLTNKTNCFNKNYSLQSLNNRLKKSQNLDNKQGNLDQQLLPTQKKKLQKKLSFSIIQSIYQKQPVQIDPTILQKIVLIQRFVRIKLLEAQKKIMKNKELIKNSKYNEIGQLLEDEIGKEVQWEREQVTKNQYLKNVFSRNVKIEIDNDADQPDQTKSITHQKKKKTCFLIKHKILFDAIAKNIILSIKNSGFRYSEEDINIKDKNGNSPLYYAILLKHYDCVEFLLANKANVNQKCRDGNTPLHLVFQLATKQNLDVLVQFLKSNADLNVVNDFGFTPLAFGNQDVLQILNLQNGVASKNKQKDKDFDNNSLLKKTKFSFQHLIKKALTLKYEPLTETKGQIPFQRKKLMRPLIEAFKIQFSDSEQNGNYNKRPTTPKLYQQVQQIKEIRVNNLENKF